MRIVSQSEFRANLSKLLDQVEEDSEELIITRTGGRQHMAVIPLSVYESWKETEYLMGNPANAELIRQSIKDLDEGRGIEVEFNEDGRLVPVAELPAGKNKAA